MPSSANDRTKLNFGCRETEREQQNKPLRRPASGHTEQTDETKQTKVKTKFEIHSSSLMERQANLSLNGRGKAFSWLNAFHERPEWHNNNILM
jgi:hypothetical protein